MSERKAIAYSSIFSQLGGDLKAVKGWIKITIALFGLASVLLYNYKERVVSETEKGLITIDQLEDALIDQSILHKALTEKAQARLKREAAAIADTILSEIWRSVGTLTIGQDLIKGKIDHLTEAERQVQSSVDRNLIEVLDELEASRKQQAILELDRKIDQRMNRLETLIKEEDQSEKDKIE